MKFIVYSDIHGKNLPLPDESPDMVFVTGDIDWRDIKRIDEHFTCPIIGVLGNHDRLDTFKGTSIIHAHKKVIEVKGFKIAGFDGCPIYNNKGNSPQYSEMQAHMFTRTIEDVDIFLAHSNPAYEYNSDQTDAHRGFSCFTELMNNNKVSMFMHGHTHENEAYKYKDTIVFSTYGMRIVDFGFPKKVK